MIQPLERFLKTIKTLKTKIQGTNIRNLKKEGMLTILNTIQRLQKL